MGTARIALAHAECGLQESHLFSPTKIIIDAFVGELARGYLEMYGSNDQDIQLITSSARRSLEIIANSDAPYHDLNHTALVTLVVQEILRGKTLHKGSITAYA